ncbi:hypothetical protein PoB_006006200 [Plakobranchus ocellatus]|uniref:Uncharacterized protein n=1 Tax=Plakobranchus ocellatus TaxID=259542 RepID=A0AAV4CNU6_9GAST|nr:hypothetical protein PoB_006006200 [Plakobranchus ocellatus]
MSPLSLDSWLNLGLSCLTRSAFAFPFRRNLVSLVELRYRTRFGFCVQLDYNKVILGFQAIRQARTPVASRGFRNRDRRISAALGMDSLSTTPPTPPLLETIPSRPQTPTETSVARWLASQPGDLQGSFCRGFKLRHRRSGLSEGLKPEITLLWTGYVQKTSHLLHFPSHARCRRNEKLLLVRSDKTTEVEFEKKIYNAHKQGTSLIMMMMISTTWRYPCHAEHREEEKHLSPRQHRLETSLVAGPTKCQQNSEVGVDGTVNRESALRCARAPLMRYRAPATGALA